MPRCSSHCRCLASTLLPCLVLVLSSNHAQSADIPWALQPVRAQPLPQVRQSEWQRSRVDHFILARIEGAGLKPSADADAVTLLRRLSFDLIGLPPTLEQLDRFTLQDLPATVAKLLASPEFGARWGRHWLDVARYAESSGSTRNMTYPEGWRYRNYVVRAFNRDVPFDQFVREQLAGDLLPAANEAQRDEQVQGTGFLAVGVKSLGEQDTLLYEMNLADDQIDATCHAFLALSANCARCHDHKFDPIPTRDYHAMAGIFRSTRHLAGVQTNNRQEPAALVPIGRDGVARMRAVQAHEVKLSAMNKDYMEVVKKYDTTRQELTKAGFAPAKAKREAMPQEMAQKLDVFTALETEVKQRADKIAALRKVAPVPPPGAMGVQDAELPADCPLFEKGEVKKPLAKVPRGALSVVPVKLAPIGPHESGRLQLANWIASPDNPLTARVIVNRVWLHLFGRGLVDTPDDFGKMGARPSHPELLDDLAFRFMNEGHWSVKWLVRELVLSRVYQQSSSAQSADPDHRHAAPGTSSSDPNNILLARMSPRRLEAEPLRDALLFLSGSLDLRPLEGSQVADVSRPMNPQGRELGRKGLTEPFSDDGSQRSVYLPVVRGAEVPSMQCFNAADPANVIDARSQGISPAQSLLLMNSNFVMKAAQGLAQRTAGVPEANQRLTQLWRMVMARPPSASELAAMKRYMETTPNHDAAWAEICQVLLQSAEFQVLY